MGSSLFVQSWDFWNKMMQCIKLHRTLTWVLSKQVAQQSRVCPVEHVLNAHTVWDPSTEALSNVAAQEVSVGVPLAVRHQEQHPHESHVGCNTNKDLTSASQAAELLPVLWCIKADFPTNNLSH